VKLPVSVSLLALNPNAFLSMSVSFLSLRLFTPSPRYPSRAFAIRLTCASNGTVIARFLRSAFHRRSISSSVSAPPAIKFRITSLSDGTSSGANPTTFKFEPQHFVFGDEAGSQVKDVKTAWQNAVLKAHGVKPQRTGTAGLSAECQSKLAEIDLHFHDLRHEAGSRKLEAGWPLHAVSVFLGHSNVTTTARYLNVKADYLHELNERAPLRLVK
jgi:hypothetical protein